MDDSETQSNMVWYNYTPTVEGVITSATPVSIEIGSDIARQLNQVTVPYGNFSSISSQPQHIIITHPHDGNIPVTLATDNHIDEVQIQAIPARNHKNKMRGMIGLRVPCPHCGKTFSCNANLRDHIRLHTGERPFSCSECGLSFAQRSNWRLHKRVHTGEKPYMCGICGKTFSRSSHLPGHMRVHTGERPFNCDTCCHAFTSSQALKNHVRTHTGEKPYICDICQTPFTHSSSLSSHRKGCTGERRKRGRPLGSGQRPSKKKTTRARGRPRKKGRGRTFKRKKKNLSECETITEIDEKDSKSINMPISVELQAVPVKLENELVEISLEVVKSCGKISNAETLIASRVGITNHDGARLPLDNSILPNDDTCIDHKIILMEDMVKAVTSPATINDPSDLDQEAAVTMATLHHGAVNLVHQSVYENFSHIEEHSETDI